MRPVRPEMAKKPSVFNGQRGRRYGCRVCHTKVAPFNFSVPYEGENRLSDSQN